MAPAAPDLEQAPAAPVEPSGVITPRDALALALLHNPALAAFSWDIRAAEARELQASLFPNPEVGIEMENVSGDLDGFRESETTVSVAQSFLLGGKRGRAMRLATAERQVAGWEYESRRLDVYALVVQAFTEVLGAQEDLRIAQETTRVAEEVLETAQKRVQAGAAASVERTRAEVALAQARTELTRATQALQAARIALALTWGSTNPRFSEAAGALETSVALPRLEVLRRRLGQNPDLIAASAQVTMHRAAADLERARRVPDVTLSAGYRRLEGVDADTMVFGLSLPIPIFDRNQGAIQEAEAKAARAEWERRAAIAAAEAALAATHAELAAALEEDREYREQILPGSTEAFRLTREGYQRGAFDYLELLTAQETLAKTRSEHVKVLVRLNHAVARIERLLGEPIRPLGPGGAKEETGP